MCLVFGSHVLEFGSDPDALEFDYVLDYSELGLIFAFLVFGMFSLNFGSSLLLMSLCFDSVARSEVFSISEEFVEVKTRVTEDRDTLIDAAADKIEKDLILLGSTAVEDKLQKGVPDCIDKLSQAGVKIWVLSGDKTETAINIG